MVKYPFWGAGKKCWQSSLVDMSNIDPLHKPERAYPIWESNPNATECYDPTPLHKLAGLTDKQSEAIRLYHDGATIEQVAGALEIGAPAALERIQRAKDKLREYGKTLQAKEKAG